MTGFSRLKKKTLWYFRKAPFRALHHKITYGAFVGDKFSIGRGSVIIGEEIRVGNNVRIGRNVILIAKEVFIGDEVAIHSQSYISCNRFKMDIGSRIWGRCDIKGIIRHKSSVEIGKFVWIFSGCYLDATYGISIGDFAGVSERSMIWTHTSWQSPLDGFPQKFAGTVIGRNTYLGSSVIVLAGVTIGGNSTIGAGSVIANDIPEKSLAAGIPAKVIKDSSKHPRHVGEEERYNTVVSILDEYMDELNGAFNLERLLGCKMIGATKGDKGQIIVRSGKEKFEIHLVRRYIKESSDLPEVANRGQTLVIALNGVEEEQWLAMDGFFGCIDLKLCIFKLNSSRDVSNELLIRLWNHGISVIHEKYKAYALGLDQTT